MTYTYLQSYPIDIHEKLKDSKLIFTDTETSGLISHVDKPTLLQLNTLSTGILLIDLLCLNPSELELLQEIFDAETTLVGHNLKFDIKMLWTIGIDITRCKLFDTYIAYKLLNNHIPSPKYKEEVTEEDDLKKNEKLEQDQGSSLKIVLKKYLGIEISKEEQKSDWTVRPLSEQQLTYAATDVQLEKLYELIKEDLKAANLLTIYAIEAYALPAVACMEYVGMPTTKQYWENLYPKYQTKVDEASVNLLQALGSKTQTTWNGESLDTINFKSSRQLKTRLHELGVLDPDTDSEGNKQLLTSTDNSVIARLSYTEYPVLGKLSTLRKASKLLDSYVSSYPSKINPITGRIHANFWQLGTITGRFSCTNPNLQTIPSRPKEVSQDLKGGFIAPEGYSFISSDFSQIELRMMTQLTKAKTWVEAFNKDLDLYCLYGAKFNNIPYENTPEWCEWFVKNHKDLRQKAKPFVLGYIYGLGPAKAKDNAKAIYGVEVTLEEAKLFRKLFFQDCPEILSYIESQYQKATKTKELRTLSGRRITGYIKYTQGSNIPDQGTCADILKLGMGRLYSHYHSLGYVPGTLKPSTNINSASFQPPINICLCIHDEIIIICRDDLIPVAVEYLEQVMIETASKYITCIPVKSEPIIGKTLAEVKD